MTIDCVIVTFRNPADQLKACLTSLVDTGIQKIVVVDNEPDGKLKAVAEKFGARYLNTPNNPGFAAAANLGATSLAGDLIFFMNPDAALISGSLLPAVYHIEQNPNTGIIGFVLQNNSGALELFGFGEKVTPFSLIARQWQRSFLPPASRRVGWVSGGALLIKRSLFLKLNGFDPKFFMYWEDVDLCLRASKLGYDTVLLPEVRLTHQHGASLSDNQQRTRYYDDAADKYFRKHYSKPLWLFSRYSRRIYRFFSPLSR